MGYEVYLLDWGSPGYEDKKIGLDTYIEKYLKQAVKRAIRHSGAEEITIIGYWAAQLLLSTPRLRKRRLKI